MSVARLDPLQDMVAQLCVLGWNYSAAQNAMVSPEGVIMPIEDMKKLVHDPKTIKAMRDAVDHANRVKNQQHLMDAQQYAAGPSSARGATPVSPPGMKPGDVWIQTDAGVAKPLFPGSNWSPYDRLKARLNIPTGDTFGLDYCHIFDGPNTTFVFVVKGDKALILDDIKDLFPSDSMVARFRLFQETE